MNYHSIDVLRYVMVFPVVLVCYLIAYLISDFIVFFCVYTVSYLLGDSVIDFLASMVSGESEMHFQLFKDIGERVVFNGLRPVLASFVIIIFLVPLMVPKYKFVASVFFGLIFALLFMVLVYKNTSYSLIVDGISQTHLMPTLFIVIQVVCQVLHISAIVAALHINYKRYWVKPLSEPSQETLSPTCFGS